MLIQIRKGKKIGTISIDNSNCLKGIMAICVVLHHLSQSTHTFSAFLDFGPIAVGCFFFISGYGLYASYSRKRKAYLNGYPWKRFKKLIIPFIFVICLYQIIRIILSYNLPGNVLYELCKGNVNLILPHSWYIFVAIIFYFIFYLIFKFSKNDFIGLVICWLSTILLFCVIILLLHWEAYWGKSLFLFPIGISYKYFENKFINKSILYIITILCFLLIFISVLGYYDFNHLGMIIANIAPYIYILPLTAINISSRFLNFLGKISYEIYLIQGVVFLVMRHILSYFGINSNYIFICLSLLFIVISAWLVKYFLDRIDPFWDKLKNGN